MVSARLDADQDVVPMTDARDTYIACALCALAAGKFEEFQRACKEHGLIRDLETKAMPSEQALIDRRAAIIARMNWVAAQSSTVRAELDAACTLLGHEPTGEVYHTTIPTQTCWWCLAHYVLPEGSKR